MKEIHQVVEEWGAEHMGTKPLLAILGKNGPSGSGAAGSATTCPCSRQDASVSWLK